MELSHARTVRVIALLLIVSCITQGIYTALYFSRLDVPRQLLWGSEGVIFALLAALAGSAMVRSKRLVLVFAAIAFSAGSELHRRRSLDLRSRGLADIEELALGVDQMGQYIASRPASAGAGGVPLLRGHRGDHGGHPIGQVGIGFCNTRIRHGPDVRQ